METWRTEAAANNADWCDVVCRSLGIATRRDRDAWTTETRPPSRYPDAVTLSAAVPAGDILRRIDTLPGCAIKDSFGDLDLAPYGFEVLFDAEWIVRPPPTPPTPGAGAGWKLVRDSAGVEEWANAWSVANGVSGISLSSVLSEDSVALLARYLDRRIAAGAVLNRSSLVVGLSNYFSDPTVDQDEAWSSCVRYAASKFDKLPLVGYEAGDRLRAALNEGFRRAGDLRVWRLPA